MIKNYRLLCFKIYHLFNILKNLLLSKKNTSKALQIIINKANIPLTIEYKRIWT
jgi:hypothetical protein